MDLLLPPPIVVVDAAPLPGRHSSALVRNETGTIFRGPISLAIAPTNLFSSTILASVTEVAGRTWSEGAAVRFEVAASPGADDDGDGLSSIVVHTAGWPARFTAGALAQTVLRVGADGFTREGDVHLNAAEYTFSADGRGDPGTIDLRGVLLHEFGHVLGLGHSGDGAATMYAAYPISRPLAWRSLEADDRAGALALYPGAGDGGCILHACPSGFLCVANRCEERRAHATSCSPCRTDGKSCDGAGSDARCFAEIGVESGVCARNCATDADCGGGENRCVATSGAGDFRCASDCRQGPAACEATADCTDFPESVCSAGVCLYPSIADGGTQDRRDAASDAGTSSGAPPDSCSLQIPGGSASSGSLASIGAGLAVAGALRRALSRNTKRPR